MSDKTDIIWQRIAEKLIPAAEEAGWPLNEFSMLFLDSAIPVATVDYANEEDAEAAAQKAGDEFRQIVKAGYPAWLEKEAADG